jgi:cell division protein FtsI (penicillin-binding protein 3)
MNIKRAILVRVRIAFLLVTVFVFAIIFKLVDIQFLQGGKWQKLAENIGLQFKVVKATRGNIFAADGSLLATSLPFYKVVIDPTIPEEKVYKNGIMALASELSNHFKDKSADEYYQKINNARVSKRKYLVLSRRLINYQEKKAMKSWPIFKEGRLKGGVIFEKVDKRFNPFKDLAHRTVGYINEENYGVGLEYSFNKHLAGRNGEALFQKMAGGSWKPTYNDSDVSPEQGLDIESTIDVNIQDVAQASLQNALEHHKANYGCVVLMEVATGEIKAMANLGKDKNGNYVEKYNYAVGNHGLTDPGSTFKLASMMALFEETEVEPHDTVDTGNGWYQFYNRSIYDTKGYGKITLQEAFEKSSNIGVMKKISENFGNQPQKFIDYINQFGMSKPLNFQMIGEAIPYVKNPSEKSWSGISLPWMSIGYELKISPLHTLTLYNAVANNGKMVKPMIVKRVRKADKIIEEFSTEVLNEKICSENTLQKLRPMLEGVVERGTATNIRGTVYKIAGKTGTARKLDNGKYSTQRYYTSFAGYFPAHKPKYSCIVVIDDPQGFQMYGASVAAPVFKEVADKIYSIDIEMHKFLPKVVKNADEEYLPLIKGGKQSDLKYLCNVLQISNHSITEDEWVIAKPNNKAVKWESNEWKEDKVPNVQGMTLRDALYLLENRGLEVLLSGNGSRVKSQSVTPGSKVIRGNKIMLLLS